MRRYADGPAAATRFRAACRRCVTGRCHRAERHVAQRGPLPPGDYNLQVQITNTGGEPVGEFGRVAVSDTPSPLGEAVLLRRGVAATPRYVRTADPRFVRTDRLRMELPTDDPGTAKAVLHDRDNTTKQHREFTCPTVKELTSVSKRIVRIQRVLDYLTR